LVEPKASSSPPTLLPSSKHLLQAPHSPFFSSSSRSSTPPPSKQLRLKGLCATDLVKVGGFARLHGQLRAEAGHPLHSVPHAYCLRNAAHRPRKKDEHLRAHADGAAASERDRRTVAALVDSHVKRGASTRKT